ncbi:MAG TPA: substrate-binding domain-containing protein [Chthonomonadaceae bacterium]|nr:substrate-binding domain-containing protein [Chthonomonadaceae bacterium]
MLSEGVNTNPISWRTVLFISYHDLNNPDFLELYSGAHAALTDAYCRLSLCVTGDGHSSDPIADERAALLWAAKDTQIAGLILWYIGGEANLPALQAFQATGRPLVFVDRLPPGIEADYVGVDNREAASAIVRALIARGHRRIAHLTYAETTSTVVERHEGYRSALEDHGLEYDKSLVVPVTYTHRGYDPALEDLLRFWRLFPGDPPTAVFAVNDTMAQLTANAAYAIGLRVPEDLAIAGFDGAEMRSAAGIVPFFTTAEQPLEQMGREAAYLLAERLKQPAPPAVFRHVTLQAPVVQRASTEITLPGARAWP